MTTPKRDSFGLPGCIFVLQAKARQMELSEDLRLMYRQDIGFYGDIVAGFANATGTLVL